MGNVSSDDNEHWVTSLKKGLFEFQKTISALKTPVDPSQYIWEYGKIVLNIDTGLLKFGNKEIQMRQRNKVFKIIKLLLGVKGNEVSYDEIIKSLDLPNKTNKEQRQSRSYIGSSIRDLRRRLDIDTISSKESNPFIATGRGIKLAFFSK